MALSARFFAAVLGLVFLAGCGPQTRYTWCNYNSALYDHYKNPAQYEEFVEALKEAVMKAESAGKVPPGLYAEYGYVLYEHGNNQQAVQYFQKEADKWPESRAFMAKMINNVQKGTKKKESKAETPKIDTAAGQIANTPTEVNK